MITDHIKLGVFLVGSFLPDFRNFSGHGRFKPHHPDKVGGQLR